MIINAAVLKLIRFYQLTISSVFPQTCRYNLSCSHYALFNIKKFGLVIGGFYSLSRIVSCHPWNKNLIEE